ncbi:SPFH domain-containing protein [Kitasatospora viridis]|uniref:Putative membrane protein YqiK n=1 Tax=Kitasatospora viridis TaxID=281105 RepID=A0A561UC87_9ACTN|nr:SPFH domain-containing protein [Kitasatospora viridis]TWF96959.1 putative membrane protein YqiK [Kitasatospora viridis]
MSVVTIGIGVLVAVLLLIGLGTLLLFGRLFRKVVQGEALIISRPKGVAVTFTGALVLPMVHRAEVMDISVKAIEIHRAGKEGMICKDNIRADIQITFFVRVNKTVEDVVKVAQAIGTERASHQETLQNLFSSKFAEALRTVGKQLDFADLYTHREEFRDRIIAAIGTDLNGYHLEDAAIDHLEQTPLAQLDPTNILDAQGIRKITELTALEHIRTNDFQRNEQMEITRQDVDAREAVLELERRRAEAEIRQRKGIETLKAQEEAATAQVQEEERLKAQGAALRTEELLGVQRENQQREIAVAEKNRERVLAVETERIEKDRMLEVVNRDREVQLAKAEMEKEVEAEKRGVAEVVRERIAVERTVAEQEEEIKRVRVVQEAERTRQSVIIAAEAEAQEQLVKDIKAAEVAEQTAHLRAKEQLVLAEAGQKSAELEAAANLRRAEGERALAGAVGLAEAEVAERQALADAAGVRARLEGEAAGLKEKAEAIEKVGLAEAAVAERKANAEAAGIREKLLADASGVRARLESEAAGLQEKAAAIQKVGLAEAAVAESKANAEAAGIREKLLADAAGVRARLESEAAGLKEKAEAIEKVGLAEAAVAERMASAEAAGIREKLLGEAAGLEKKAIAMAALDEVSRSHEEFRLRLAADKDVRMAQLEVQAKVAEAQASVLAAGLESADIDIVGGDSVFLDKLVGAISFGKSIDGAVQGSDIVQALGADWLSGERKFSDDATEVLRGLAAGGPWNLAMLTRLLGSAGDGVLPAEPVRVVVNAAGNAAGNGTGSGAGSGTGK